MGLWDKVKSVANKITGGGAKVHISVEGNQLKGPVKVSITAEVKDAQLEVSKVYLYVKSVENARIARSELPRVNGQQPLMDLHLERDIFQKMEFQVAGPQTLSANQVYNWTYTFEIPGNPSPTYNGHYVSHEWKVLAGLDVSGNDPDSGWQVVGLF